MFFRGFKVAVHLRLCSFKVMSRSQSPMGLDSRKNDRQAECTAPETHRSFVMQISMQPSDLGCVTVYVLRIVVTGFLPLVTGCCVLTLNEHHLSGGPKLNSGFSFRTVHTKTCGYFSFTSIHAYQTSDTSNTARYGRNRPNAER